MSSISIQSLSKKELEHYHTLSSQTFGRALAMAVAEKLKTKEFYNFHRDYCGQGLRYANSRYILALYYDGYPRTELQNWNEKEFTQWFSQQSDQSMALLGDRFANQTIDMVRILWFLQDDYNANHNEYAAFTQIAQSVIQQDQQAYNIPNEDEELWLKLFYLDTSQLDISTENQRYTLLDFACLNESRYLPNNNDVPDNTINLLRNKWYNIDFSDAKTMLFNALQFDLAYSNSRLMSEQEAQKHVETLLADFLPENTYAYTNYDRNPFDRKGYSGSSLFDLVTFDLGIVFLNNKQLLFGYFLAED